ncbi:unnamed protein product [Larinioides sclopetarius]|uniref:Reverse transcriptase domain-containing protein n=1 Tax=Larinioides sclopetarius TaxID=280406 RepID=A0AAV1ZAR6_9ARAC
MGKRLESGFELAYSLDCCTRVISTLPPHYRAEFHRVRIEVNDATKHYSYTRFEQSIEELTPSKDLWRKTSLLRKPFKPIPPLRGEAGSVAIAPIEKAEVIADSLQRQFEPNTTNTNRILSQNITSEVRTFINKPHTNDLQPIRAREVEEFIQKLKPKKAPGIDLISNRMLKNIPLKFILYITLILNIMMEKSYFPNCWKTAVVVPIAKPNQNLELPQNYRPISLLSSLSKVYESVLLKRLNQFLDDKKIIISEQFGFRKNLSTSHQLLRVTELIYDGFEKSETTGALFLDEAKAFDKIWHDGLIAKLMRLSVSTQLIKIIHSFLHSRSFRVRINNTLSSPRPILSGCAQGSLLSPTLFNIYVNDIPKNPNCHLAIFADDTAVLTKHKHPDIALKCLQLYTHQLQSWLQDWKIKVNPEKCACLLFTKKRNMPILNPIQIFDQPVPFVSEYKYLGLILDAKLSFDTHIQTALNKAHKASCAIHNLIARKSKLPIKHKLLLYKAILRPIFLYGSPIWGTTSIKNLRKLQVFQNKKLMQITNSPWYVRRKLIHKDLKIKPVLDFMTINSKRFYDKIPQIPNELLKIKPYNPSAPSSRKRPRAVLDYTYSSFPSLKRRRDISTVVTDPSYLPTQEKILA